MTSEQCILLETGLAIIAYCYIRCKYNFRAK